MFDLWFLKDDNLMALFKFYFQRIAILVLTIPMTNNLNVLYTAFWYFYSQKLNFCKVTAQSRVFSKEYFLLDYMNDSSQSSNTIQ